MKENVSKQERKMKSVDEIYDTIDEMADLEGSETSAVAQEPSKSSNALLKVG